MRKKKVLVGISVRIDLPDLSFPLGCPELYISLEEATLLNRNMRLVARTILHHDLYHERLGHAEKPLSEFSFIPKKVDMVEKLEKPLFRNVIALGIYEYRFVLNWAEPLDLFTRIPTLVNRVIQDDIWREKSR